MVGARGVAGASIIADQSDDPLTAVPCLDRRLPRLEESVLWGLLVLEAALGLDGPVFFASQRLNFYYSHLPSPSETPN